MVYQTDVAAKTGEAIEYKGKGGGIKRQGQEMGKPQVRFTCAAVGDIAALTAHGRHFFIYLHLFGMDVAAFFVGLMQRLKQASPEIIVIALMLRLIMLAIPYIVLLLVFFLWMRWQFRKCGSRGGQAI